MKHRSGKQMAAIARENGWVLKSQSGSHAKYRDPITGKAVTIPIHGSTMLRAGTQKTIMKVMGLTDNDL